MKLFSIGAVVVTSLLLSGCIEMLYDGAKIGKRKAELHAWKFKAEDGDVEAQYKVASLYCCGERPYYDNIEALKWYCKAAKNGQRDAQFEVAQQYENTVNYKGSIVPKDDVLAYSYYTLAEKNHHPDAAEYRARLEEDLTEEQMTEAKVLVERFPRIWCENPRRDED